MLHRLVKGSSHDLGLHRTGHVGHLLGPLPDEHDHEVQVGVVPRDAIGNLLEDGGLAGLGRRDDQAALAPADGGQHVQQARRQRKLPRLQRELFEGEDGRQPVEPGTPFRLFRVHVVDRLDPQQAKVLFAFLWRADLADHGIACSQPKAPDLRLRHIDIIRAGKQIAGAQEANAIGHDVQDAAAKQQALAFGLSL